MMLQILKISMKACLTPTFIGVIEAADHAAGDITQRIEHNITMDIFRVLWEEPGALIGQDGEYNEKVKIIYIFSFYFFCFCR